MAGTVIITGANGSLGLAYVERLLETCSTYTLIAAVRNPSPEADSNTAKLKQILRNHERYHTSIEELDLASLASVRSFADSVNARVEGGEIPPIAAIICNAFAWSLDEGQKFTPDGYELGFQVTHLSHFLLVLKLLGSMNKGYGRVVMIGSAVHDPKNGVPWSKLHATVPGQGDVEELVHPKPDAAGQAHDRGFQRYATSKLANVMFMHDLNARLDKDPKLKHVCATAMDPGGLPSSRAHVAQRASTKALMSTMNFFLPILQHVTDQVRSTTTSARDLVELSVGPKFQFQRGYFNGHHPIDSAPESRDVSSQRKLWTACWNWAGLRPEETALKDVE